MPEKFATIADAEAYTPVSTPAFLETAGSYAAGDGGDALYANPVTVNPGKTDQIEINVNGTATYYNRLHKDGKVDVVKHGALGNGRHGALSCRISVAERAAALGTTAEIGYQQRPGNSNWVLWCSTQRFARANFRYQPEPAIVLR